MNELRKAAEMACQGWEDDCAITEMDGLMKALRQALAQAEKQPIDLNALGIPHGTLFQPAQQQEAQIVRWKCPCGNEVTFRGFTEAPPKRNWVGLSEDEVISHFQTNVDTGSLLSFADGVRYAESKLKEKNGG